MWNEPIAAQHASLHTSAKSTPFLRFHVLNGSNPGPRDAARVAAVCGRVWRKGDGEGRRVGSSPAGIILTSRKRPRNRSASASSLRASSRRCKTISCASRSLDRLRYASLWASSSWVLSNSSIVWSACCNAASLRARDTVNQGIRKWKCHCESIFIPAPLRTYLLSRALL